MKDVFKLIHIGVVQRAKDLVNTYNKSTSKWLVRLNTESKNLYGTSLALLRIVDVRWNSTQACFASILRIRSALKLVEVKYSTDADFPDQLRIETGLFESLIEAEQSICPLVLASMLMQRDSNTLADVVNMFGILY